MTKNLLLKKNLCLEKRKNNSLLIKETPKEKQGQSTWQISKETDRQTKVKKENLQYATKIIFFNYEDDNSEKLSTQKIFTKFA